MAVRLSIAFVTTAESWLNQQLQYDLWHAERNGVGFTWRNWPQPDPGSAHRDPDPTK